VQVRKFYDTIEIKMTRFKSESIQDVVNRFSRNQRACVILFK